MDQNVLAAIVKSAGYELYSYTGCYGTTRNAKVAELTKGRTPYFTKGSARFFDSKVLALSETYGGVFLKVTESSKGNYDGTAPRIFRAFLVDVDGNIHERPSAKDGHSSRLAAEKAFFDWYKDFNPVAAVVEMLARKKRILEREVADHAAALAKIEALKG